eukprot:UN06826
MSYTSQNKGKMPYFHGIEIIFNIICFKWEFGYSFKPNDSSCCIWMYGKA